MVGNMMKALYFQFTAGVVPLYAVCFIGYWAYGNNTSSYLLNSVNGPVWVKAMANFAAFLQTVIALHVNLLPSDPLSFTCRKCTNPTSFFSPVLADICKSNVRISGYKVRHQRKSTENSELDIQNHRSRRLLGD